MRTFQYFLYTILISSLFTINSCKEDDVIPMESELEKNEVILKENEAFANVIPNTEISTFLTGKITDEQGNGINGVEVSYKNTSVTTNNEGVFVFGEIQLNEKYALIEASKTGFLNGFRTFTPTENAFNTISIQLLNKGNAKSFNASDGGSLAIDSDINLEFSANSITDKNGNAFEGEVKVYGRYLSPTDEDLSQIMPGMLAGLTEGGDIDALVSFGMLNIELEDAAGNELEIAANQTVEIDLPAAADAPTTIPLWHFNETYGLWIEAGSATKTGDRYIGTVNHFSTWNLDTYENGFDVDVTVQDQSGNNLANQRVDIYSATNDLLATVYTDNNGEFTLLRAPQNLVFRVVYPCDSEDLTKDISGGNVTLIANLSNSDARNYTLSGQIFDCDNVAYSNRFFTISSTNNIDNIYFGGITNDVGSYELTTILCDIDEVSIYNLNASVIVGNGIVKDSIISITFNSSSQLLNIDYCGTSTDSLNDNFIVPIIDSRLENEVRDIINKPTGSILYGDIKDLKNIVLNNSYVSNISGLEYFHGLETLILNCGSSQCISDLSPLLNLINLTHLELGGNSIVDLSPLSNLINLTNLNLRSNNVNGMGTISGFTILSNLTNLTVLDISSSRINNISFLANLNKLDELNLFLNQISDLSPISNLTDLSYLDLGINDVLDLSSLSSLTNLVHLNLQENNVSDISALSNLINLEFLDFYDGGEWPQNNSISDVSPISNLANVSFLSLGNNSVDDVTSLCNFGNTFNGEIYLKGNPLTNTDITNLETCLPNATIEF